MRKCSICGESGHNSRTCSQRTAKPAKPKGRVCGNCGEPGHNRRTCTQLEVIEESEEDGYLEEEEIVVEKPKKKASKCRDCGEEGHTAKKCPYKPLPEGVEIGPKLMECGHFSWWLKDGECELCSGALYRRRLNDPIEEAA